MTTAPATTVSASQSPATTVSASQSPATTVLASQSPTSTAPATEPCVLPCLNGGQCVQSESCDCSLYQATGHRCQTVPNPGFDREMTCRTWGQYNFETFDGLYYYFPGRCTYTLLRDCEETAQASIVVQVHNDPGCGSAPYTCQRSVSLFLPWEGEVRLHATNVTFKGQSLELPHHIHDLQLEQISQYVLVTQQHGFTLAWEGRSGSVYIKLSPEFVGRTCGLCGNFNADVQDDLRTSYGVLTHEIEMFGNSWVETQPHQAQCPTVSSGFSSPCAAVDAHVLLKVEEVCAMLLDPPFESCHDFVSPLSYMASCSNDLCMSMILKVPSFCESGPNGEVVCQVFSEYARACAHADHPLHDWRQRIPQCAKQCPLGLQYRECISCCPESCNLERTCIDSKLACLDGCYCPDGLIYEDGGCVMPSDCPCEYHGMFYPSGQTLQEECNNCTCVGGVWNCTDYSCPGECSVTGDMYFQSFDGRIYTFPATCQYVLAKSRNSGKFTVTIQNAPCGANLDGACIQSVNLVVDEDPRTEITLSHVGEVFMAGQYRISLPYSDDTFHVQELSSMFLQVRTAFGLHLQYSWKEFRLYLQADELWKDDTVGLCGTFNGNIQDDFLSPSGMIESTPQLFGNAWRVSSACSPSLSTPQLDPCDTHQQTVAYASEMCDVLNQDLFSACHEYLSPTPFHQQCRSDTCKCGTPCLCSALAHYARHCRRFSVIIDFRSHIPDCAVTCPATMQYGTCVSSCQRRCSALSVPQHCGEECEEGCVCPQGSFYNHRTHTCVHRLCLNGKLVSQTTDSDRLCPAGQLYQNCSEGEDGILPGRGVACERTCESYLLNLTCSTHEPCVAGCTCPPGLLKHGDECFEPAACPCLWKGKEYYPGDRVSSPCHQCVCQHGTFQCVFRPCPSMCTAYGDRHYRTFDGLLFDYVGACKVYLVKSSADVMLSVSAENMDCFDSGVICRKSLLINIGRSFVAFDDDTGKPNPSSVIDRKQRMFIWPAGYFTVIHFPEEDVTVLWDRKTTVHIQVGPRWQGKLSGLCGNFDLKTVNEMRTPDNIDSPTPQEFGNSWTAAECVNSPDVRHPCSLSPLREPFAKRQCAVLLSEVFQACHPVVDVTWFYMNCLADTCGCSRGGDCECFCTSVAAYAQRCCHQGVPVDWRSPSLCPYDCEFFNKVLGKGPFRLVAFRDQTTVLVAGRSSGFVFLQQANLSSTTTTGILSQFMMTPGLSRARPHDTSRVSFEAADRPNYFLYVSPSGQLRLAKWEESKAFWDGATFILHRNTWIPGYDSLESHAKPSFFLHATLLHLHLLKYRHTNSFRKATLFRLTGSNPEARPGPQCQWRYDSCVSPCFKTCSDPSAEACVTIPQVEGCLPVCPPHMVLDEVTRRCVYVEDCIKAPVVLQPVTPSTAQVISTAVTSAATTTTAASTTSLKTTVSTKSSTAPHTGPTSKTTATVPATSTQTTSTKAPPAPDEPTRTAPTTPSATPELSRTAGTPSSPTAPPAVRPEVVEPLSTVRVTEAPPTTVTGTTLALSSTTSPFSSSTFRTSSAPFAITALFWLTSSTKPTDSLLPTRPSAPPTTSIEWPTIISTPPPVVLHTAKETTEATTHSAAVTPTVTSSSPGPTLTSETLVTDKTTVPSTATTAENHSDHNSKTSRGSRNLHRIHRSTNSSASVSHRNHHCATITNNREHRSSCLYHADLRAMASSPSGDLIHPCLQPHSEDYTRADYRYDTSSDGPSGGDNKSYNHTAFILSYTHHNNYNHHTDDNPQDDTQGSFSRYSEHDRTRRNNRSSSRPDHHNRLSACSYFINSYSIYSRLHDNHNREPGIPTPATTSHPVATTVQTPELDRVDRTSPGATTPPSPPSPTTHTAETTTHTAETTTHTAESTTSMAVSTSRMCTPPYAEIVDECTKYICVNNQLVLFNKSRSCPFSSEPPNCGLLGFAILVNGDKCCPQWDCPCRCSMFPDLNVITFDGNSVAIYKAASYIVTQLPNETVSVLVQECPADSESLLLWNFTNLCLVALNITHKSNHIVINRLQRRLYINSRYAKPRFKKYGFEIYDTGNMYLIRSPAGLKLQWYHSTGMMVIDTDSSSNKLPTKGLCGFCDGDPTNDLTLANGTTVGVSEDPALFIDSWQVPNTTSYISHSRRRELNCSTSDCSSCLLMLQNPAFSPCHAFVPPSTFCEVWVRDAEYVNNQCVALAAYVASCHKFNICIEWRSPDYCPFLCPDTLRYQACLPACTSQSCPNHDFDSDPDQCSGLTEGCVCPEGTLLHRPYSALCISPEKCACTDSSGVPRAHGEVWKASKDACCMYRCDNDTIVPVEYNCSNVAVPVCRRAGEVIISLADDSSCCPQKVCVCNQSLCDLLPPECKYGEKLVSYYRQDSCCPDYVCECDPDLCESDVPACREDQTLIATRADGSCCLAHMCMCSSCPETPPHCQDGEVLTVDGNTTDRCCPAYHCVCEPYRCPQISCPVGMSVMSLTGTGQCCPNQTCECSCEKIASPKCGLGEAAQVDRAFLSDPQNQCACKRYKCGERCWGGKEGGRLLSWSSYCTFSVMAVCVFGERGVLRPGQTLVEHGDDGLCHSRQCSRSLDPTSGFHLLRTSSINCSAHCQPNQIYVPPKDQSTCCGVCKNISCLYEHENGTTALYKPGKSWVSNCMKFDCTDTLSGPTLISYSFSCPPFNETECMKIGGTVVSYMDGCCKTCKEDGKSCQKVTVRMTIRKNDCRSNRPVNIVSCDGKCPSASIYNYNINTYARFCKCCRETGLQRRSVQLYCSGNATWVSYTIQEPTDCSCQWS
ncbi:otogelin-like [Seriola dumerili]|uniref:otogelin-like n=1 Tax=Seriola dumerili TaxID=41447 RepID=UPI000BBE5BFF|nr:otogelin-like [Seriola dumerili]